MLKPEKLSPNHEELFLQRYMLLRSWALRLTGNDPQPAEDLLHDAFIHFAIHHPSLEEIKNLEGYLHTMLRNLHLSQSRRAARSAHGHFLILDYDSAEIGLYAIDPREQIKAQDELQTICRYACLRKESSKAGSVLILRFFHGYYPDEIAQVMSCTRSAVEHHLRLARSEAKVFLQNPEALAFMQKRRDDEPVSMNFGTAKENVLENLRHAIFHSTDGECLSVEQVNQLYHQEESTSLDCATLAHIVSCPSCMEKVNTVLGLPPLSERNATDSLGPNTRSKGGGGGADDGGGGGNAAAVFAKKSRRRMRQVLKHSPQELHISVNGFILGSQKISSEVSELTFNVSLDEKIGFVEVFSENDIRLFFLNIEPPPDGPVEQPSRIELSDGRSLELALNFSDTWPKLYIVYHDPLLASESALESLGSRVEIEQSPKSKVQSPKSSEVQNTKYKAQSSLFKLAGLWTEVRRRCSDVGRWTLDIGLFRRPGMVTAIFAVLLTAVLLFVQLRGPNPPLTFAELLHQSSVAEEVLAAKTDILLHRTISLEERQLNVGQSDSSINSNVISRRRLDLWENGAQKIKALRVYDEQNRLVNGEWTKSDGSRIVYNHSTKLRNEPGRKFSAESLAFNDVWKLKLSASEFSSLTEHAENKRVEESATAYTITVQNNTSGDLKSATLKLNRPELRAIEMTLVVASEMTDDGPQTTDHGQNANRQSTSDRLPQRGSAAAAADNRQFREYRFSESSFEQRAANAVAPAVFEPDPELLGSDTGTRRHNDTANIPVSPRLHVPVSPVAASAELEVEVLRLLNQAAALSGEQIGMTRTPEGQLRVQGIVDTEQRKREILNSLSPVLNNAAVSVEILTASEAINRQRSKSTTSSGATSVEGVSPAHDMIPVDAEVRRYLSAQGTPTERIDEEIRQFSRKVMNRSRRIRLHALALKQIVERFSTADLQTLEPSARAKWRAMIVEHARAIQQESVSLRRDLEKIFPGVSVSAATETEMEINQDRELAQAVTRLYSLASMCDENVSLSFSIGASQSASPVKTTQFWLSLKSAERLAATVQRYGDK